MAQYIVKPGETLWGIAQANLGSGARWKELGYTGDPTKLQIGTVLNIPEAQPAPGVAPAVPTSPVQAQTTQFPNLAPTAPNQAVLDIKTSLERVLADLKTKQDLLARAEASGFGAGTGKEIPGFVETAKTPEEAKAIAEAPISAPIAEPRREERIGELEEKVFVPPTETWQEIKEEEYKKRGLDKEKEEIKAIDIKINKARDDLVTAEQGLIENPWLSQTALVGRTKTLYEVAERRISNLLAQREQLWSFYQEGIRQAENVATRTQAEAEAGRKLKADELEYLVKMRKGEPTKPKTFKTDEGTFVWEYDKSTGKFTAKKIAGKGEGTPQLKQSETGEWTWIFPSGKTVGSGITGTEKKATTAEQKSTEINTINNQLSASKGKDGFVDPGVYQKLRLESSLSPSEFDSRFKHLLSEQEQKNIGITKVSEPTAWEYDASIWQWLAGEGAGFSDEERAQQIKELGRNPESFGIYGY